MGFRFALALGLGLAAVWSNSVLAVDHLVFGLTPGHTFDIYQNSQRIQTGRGSSAGGALVFESNGGGSFQIVSTGGTVDVTPPAAVTTLAVTGTTPTSITLRWNTTGDDGNTGTASVFDVRYATFPITASSWSNATQASGEPNPGPPGAVQTFAVNNLQSGTNYYFALKVGDEVPNWSPISNVTSAATGGGSDTSPPSAITTLAVTSTTTTTATLNWTAVGDDGTTGRASSYDIRFSTSPITVSNWSQASQFSGEPIPGNSGVLESFVGTGLTPDTNYYFGMRVADEAQNWSPISNSPSGRTLDDAPQDPGFPLAGFGTDTPGGAGGTPYVVTSLANSGAGTLRDAVSASNRSITFAVSGTILLQSTLQIPSHHLTIDGATAPAPGITIAPASGMTGDLVRMSTSNAHDIIIRHLRFRDGPADNFRIDGSGAHHVVLDHCSFRRPGDGNVDITTGAHDLTLQWCIFADATENALVRTGVSNVSLHHNFFIHGTRKNPRIRDAAVSTDMVNNLVYDWGAEYGTNYATGGSGNLVSNYFQSGPSSNAATAVVIESAAGPVYSSGNTVPQQSSATGTTPNRFPAPPVNETSAAQARFDVLVDAGVQPRDADDLGYAAEAGMLGGGGGGGVDTTPPAAVTDLRTSTPTQSTLRVLWTATGDDGTTGRATQYDMRYSLSPINSTNWNNAIQVQGEPVPANAGTAQSLILGNLNPGTAYYVALKVADEVLNWSALSNVATGATTNPDPEDTEPPAAITDLEVIRTTQNTATLTWTSPGDDGNEGQADVYDLRYSTSPISESNWNQAQSATSEPAPRPAGQGEIMIVGGLQPETTYYFAIKSADEIPNWSDLSNNADGRTLEVPADDEPPAPIEDLDARFVGFNRVLLGWTETGDDGTTGTASAFEVRMSGSPLTEQNWDEGAIVPNVPDPNGPFSQQDLWVRNLHERQRYFFGIKAIDEAGNASALSNILSITTPASPDTIPPPTISDLRGQPFSAHEIDLEWTAPGDGPDGDIPIAVYEIRVQTTPLGSSPRAESSARAQEVSDPIIVTVNAESPDMIDPGDAEMRRIDGLAANTTYYCSVRSRDTSDNWSEPSNEVAMTTFEEPPPPPPQGDVTPPAPIVDLAPQEIGTDFALLTWTATGDDANEGTAERYEFRMAPDSLTAENWEESTLLATQAPKTAGEPESLRVEGMASGEVYYFAVQAYDLAENASGLSNIASVLTNVVTDSVLPFPVTDLAVIDSTETSLTLRWTTPSDSFPEGAVGSEQVAEYELRYAPDTLDASGWDSATSAPVPEPRVPGENVDWTISTMEPGHAYGIALRSRDLSGNWSELSNVVVAATRVHQDDPPPPPPPDEAAPGPVSDVSLTVIDSWSARLIWTATGDDSSNGRASGYEVRRLAGTADFPPDPTREGAWDSAVALAVRIEPAEAGLTETMPVTGLSPGWLYTFAIVAIDEAGNRGPIVWSQVEQTPYVLDELPPEAVNDLAAEALSPTDVRLDWTAPTDARSEGLAGSVSGYVLRRAWTALSDESWESAPWETTWVAEAEPGDPDYVEIAGLEADTTYHFAIRSTDPSGNLSPISNAIEVRTLPNPEDPDPEADTVAPSRVSTFTGYALGPTSLRLNWIAVGDDETEGIAARTVIRWSREPITEAVWSQLDSLPDVSAPRTAGAVERFDWTGLEPAAIYYFALRVYDEEGNASALSNLIAVSLPQVQDTAPPAVPQNVQASYDLAGVHLSWDPSPDVDLAGYDIHRMREGQPLVTLATHVSGITWVDASIEGGARYTYSVSARDAAGNISASSGSVVIEIPQPTAAIISSVLEQGAAPIDRLRNEVVLRWQVEPGPDLKGFRIYREPIAQSVAREAMTTSDPHSSARPGPAAALLTPTLLKGPGPHQWVESPLPNPGIYRYWIEAVGSGTNSLYLDPIELSIPKWNDAVLALYPNPMSERMTIAFSLAEAAPVEVGIYGIDGRLLYRQSTVTMPIGPQEWSWDGRLADGEPVAAGTYFLTLRAGHTVHRERFVVMRRK